jgi:hypothetical protein
MDGRTLPGTVEMRVVADGDQTEDLSRKISGFLKSNGFNVISCSADHPDRNDPMRRKFHIVAIPKRRSVLSFNHSETGAILQDGG